MAKKADHASKKELIAMARNISYKFESYKKLDDDLSKMLEKISPYERLVVALSYINRQSDAFEYYLGLDRIFENNAFQYYVGKAIDVLEGNQKASFVIDELGNDIPDGDDNTSGWPFAFMQNALISLLEFFELVETKAEKKSSFVDIANTLLNNVDIIWHDNNEGSEEEFVIFGKEISILFNAINEISKKENKIVFINELKKMPLHLKDFYKRN